jgi:hypothetical protein
MQPDGPSIALVGVAGAYDIGFAIFHLLFWRIFRWPKAILPSGVINGAITQTLNAMLIYCFVVYGGWLIWAASSEIGPHPLCLLAGCGFWLVRTTLQPVFFGMRHGLSVMLTVGFVVGIAVHLSAAVV